MLRIKEIGTHRTTPAPPQVRLSPNLFDLFRRKVTELAITRADHSITRPAREVIPGLIERVSIRWTGVSCGGPGRCHDGVNLAWPRNRQQARSLGQTLVEYNGHGMKRNPNGLRFHDYDCSILSALIPLAQNLQQI